MSPTKELNAELQAARELVERPLVVFMTGASNWEPNEVERFYIAARTLLPKLLDEIEAMRPVVEAAVAWRSDREKTPMLRQKYTIGRIETPATKLEDVVDAYHSRKATP